MKWDRPFAEDPHEDKCLSERSYRQLSITVLITVVASFLEHVTGLGLVSGVYLEGENLVDIDPLHSSFGVKEGARPPSQGGSSVAVWGSHVHIKVVLFFINGFKRF